jgi:hypothetical protein
MERQPDPTISPPLDLSPKSAVACSNCFFSSKNTEDSNFICWADPPRLMQMPSPRRIGALEGPHIVSMRPAVQAHHFCRHFLPRSKLPAKAEQGN